MFQSLRGRTCDKASFMGITCNRAFLWEERMGKTDRVERVIEHVLGGELVVEHFYEN